MGSLAGKLTDPKLSEQDGWDDRDGPGALPNNKNGTNKGECKMHKARVSPTFWAQLNEDGRNYMRCTYRTYRQISQLDRNQARRTIDEVLWGMILGRNGTMTKP